VSLINGVLKRSDDYSSCLAFFLHEAVNNKIYGTVGGPISVDGQDITILHILVYFTAPIIFAGLPTALTLAGNDFITFVPIPTRQFSPTSMLFLIFDPLPI